MMDEAILQVINEYEIGQKVVICSGEVLDFDEKIVNGYEICLGQIFIKFDDGTIIDSKRAKQLVKKL